MGVSWGRVWLCRGLAALLVMAVGLVGLPPAAQAPPALGGVTPAAASASTELVEGFDPRDPGLWAQWGVPYVYQYVLGPGYLPSGEMQVVDAPGGPVDGRFSRAAYFPNVTDVGGYHRFGYRSRMRVEVPEGGSSLSFWFRTNMASGHYFSYSVTGATSTNWTGSGTKPWNRRTFTLAPGEWQVEFRYTRNSGSDTGAETAWFTGLEFSNARVLAADPPDEQTMGVPGDASELAARPVGDHADPVNTATGAFATAAVDASVGGRGGFAFERVYNSNDTAGGPLGPGWSHSFAHTLTVAGNTAVHRTGDGQRVRFTRAASHLRWRGDPGVTASVVTNPDGSHTVTTKAGTRYEFDAAGRLLQVADRNGQGQTLAYDAAGTLASVTTSGGRVVTLTHDAGLLSSVTLPDGRQVAFDYTGGLLTGVRDLAGGDVSYSHDGAGRLTEIGDQNGDPAVRLGYDPATGRVSDQWDALGNHSTFGWDAATATATMTDPRGGVWSDTYDGNVLVARTNPLGATVTFAYDQALALREVVTADGGRTTMRYDADGNPWRSVMPDGSTAESVYDADGDLVAVTNPAGVTAAYDHDSRGNLIRTTLPDPSGGTDERVTEATYDQHGQLSTVTDPAGRVTSHDYNSHGDHVGVTAPDGSQVAFAHDACGRVTTVTGPDLAETSYGYDALDRLVAVTDPLGRTVETDHDPAGNPVATRDAKGRATTFAFDAAGRLVETVGPDLAVLAGYAYDSAGNLTSVTDPTGAVTTLDHDLAGRVVAEHNPIGTWQFGYDPSGRRTAVTGPDGATTTIGYDQLGRMTGIDYPAGTADAGWAYDASGNRTRMTDGAGTVDYAYDLHGRLTTVTRGADTFAWTYDTAGNVASQTYPDGTAYAYTYDQLDRLTAVTRDGQPLAGYAYDLAGRLVGADLPGGLAQTRSYDPAGRLLDITTRDPADQTVAGTAYSYDLTDNPTRTVDHDGATTVYGYDTHDRLTSVCDGATCQPSNHTTYTYDPAGNRLQEATPAQVSDYTYNPAGQLSAVTVAGVGDIAFGYDSRGNETSRTVTGSSLAAQLGYQQITSSHDAAGRLASHTVDGAATTHNYDGDGRRLSSLTAGQPAAGFAWNPVTYELALEREGGLDRRRYDYGAGRVGFTDLATTGGADYGYLTDALGSVRAVTDAATGNPLATHTWQPYGQPHTTTIDPQAPANPIGWAGQHTADHGAVHLRARDYDPALGRFTSPDQGAAAAAAATYVYALANPMALLDPLGLWAWRETNQTVNHIAGHVGTVTGVAAVACGLLVICAPAAPVLGILAVGSGAVVAATSAITAADACIIGKGGCGAAIATAAIATATRGRIRGLRPPTGAAVIQPARTAWGQVVQQFRQFGDEWRRVSAHAERARARAYRGGTSIEEVFRRGDDILVRHRIYGNNGRVLHETFRPDAKFGAR